MRRMTSSGRDHDHALGDAQIRRVPGRAARRRCGSPWGRRRPPIGSGISSSRPAAQQASAPLVLRNWWLGYASQWAGSRPPAMTTQGRMPRRPGLVSTAAARCMASVTGHSTPSAWCIEADKLAQVRPADEIDDALQRRMPVARFPALDERDATLKVIHHRLIARGVPPFGREVVLAPGHQNPDRSGTPCSTPGGGDVLLLGRKWMSPRKAVKGIRRPTAAPRTAHTREGSGRAAGCSGEWPGNACPAPARPPPLLEAGEVRVVLPEGVGGRAHIRREPAGMGRVQIANGGRQHHDVPRTLKRTQHQPTHGCCPQRAPDHVRILNLVRGGGGGQVFSLPDFARFCKILEAKLQSRDANPVAIALQWIALGEASAP